MAEAVRVLIIDDSEVVLGRLKQRLTQEGFEVETTTQTVGAARYLHKCQVVILDYHMPGIDGGSVLKSLRAAIHDAATAPLFYLYSSDAEVARQHRELGFDGSFSHKGDDELLVQQLVAALRLLRLRKLAKK